jgi:hypothetical protein
MPSHQAEVPQSLFKDSLCGCCLDRSWANELEKAMNGLFSTPVLGNFASASTRH